MTSDPCFEMGTYLDDSTLTNARPLAPDLIEAGNGIGQESDQTSTSAHPAHEKPEPRHSQDSMEDVDLLQGSSPETKLTSSAPLSGNLDGVDLSTLRRTPLWNVVVNSITYMATPMSMPATMAQAGWVWGTAMLVYSALVSYHTALLLGHVCYVHPHLDTFPKVTAAAAEKFVRRVSPAAAASGGARCWVDGVLWATIALQFVTYYLDTVAQLIYIEQYFGQLLPHSRICQWQWLLVTWALSAPVMQIPTLHASRHVSVLAMAWVMLNVVLIGVQVWAVQPWECEPGPSYPPPTAPRLLIAAASMAYAFGGHGIYPEEFREMKQPERWPEMVNWMYGMVVPSYLFAGFVGYAAYGGYSQANLNLNYPNNWVNTLSILMQLPACLYLVYFTNLVLVLQIEIACGIDPTQFVGESEKWRFRMPPVVFRLFFRTAFLGSQILFAQMLLLGEGDTILALQSLAGAVGMSAFTYFLPFIVHWIIFQEEIGRLLGVYYAFNIIAGVLILVGGVYSSVIELSQSSDELDRKCLLLYSYAPESPEDPCYISGI